MNANNTPIYSGIGFLPLLALLFIGLKLGGIINWSWFLVLLPIIPHIVILTLALLLIALAGIIGYRDYKKSTKAEKLWR